MVLTSNFFKFIFVYNECSTCIPAYQKKASVPIIHGCEHHVVAGNWIEDLEESNQLSHPSLQTPDLQIFDIRWYHIYMHSAEKYVYSFFVFILPLAVNKWQNFFSYNTEQLSFCLPFNNKVSSYVVVDSALLAF